ncbi:MAG TPA: efflux RND transporter permease subunit [Candidatus Binatia bacterium]|jgi:multidrug efflux pump subunit AcrB
MAEFFVDRPIFSTVLSLVIVLVGLVALTQLPISQYPEVVPPTIQVTATYPGASAVTVAETVAQPIEQEVNGVERMLYMFSRSTNDGQLTIDVTFELGTDLDAAQVLVQNRVAIAEAKLPEEVKRLGISTKKKSPSILLVVNLVSPDGRYDQLYLSNFATLNIKDDLARVKGVGDVTFLGARDYSMRVWLDPTKLASRQMTASDVIRAIQEQNVQVAAGRIGQPPVPQGAVVPFQLPINTQGRFTAEEQFDNIIVKTGKQGQVVHLSDIVSDPKYDKDGKMILRGIELGAKNYDVNSYLGSKENRLPAATMAVFQLPGANALDTAEQIKAKMAELKSRFPEGVEYRIVYDTTVFVNESVHEVYKTLFEAFVLVFIVVLIFLGDWRATLMPMIDVPVSLIGTLAIMAVMGFSLNNLTLFGLVLAIGIVVDDAIVVVENIERWMSTGMPPREATVKAMNEITGPVIAITLVLSSVFVPTAFLAGISGQFYRQFALTIAVSVIISAMNAMTMAPARAVTLIKPHTPGQHRDALPPQGIAVLVGFIVYHFVTPHVLALFGLATPAHGETVEAGHQVSQWGVWAVRLGVFAAGTLLGWMFRGPINHGIGLFLGVFNRFFDRLANGYGKIVRSLVRVGFIVLIIYGGMLALTVWGFNVTPKGFIPEQDKGYLVLNAQLPEGASLERTDKMIAQISEVARKTKGVAYSIDVPGYSILLSTNISNIGGMFVILDPFEERAGIPGLSANEIAAELRRELAVFQEARIGIFNAPPIDGLGSTGGSKLHVQDRRAAGLRTLEGGVQSIVEAGQRDPTYAGMFSSFGVTQPQLFVDIDREKAKAQNVSLDEINTTLQAYLGSVYVNDFSFQGRNWQVNVQADPSFRDTTPDIGRLEVRNGAGDRVPLDTFIKVKTTSGPAIVNHYNIYPSAEVNIIPAPGVSSGQVITRTEQLVNEQLSSGLGFEWTELTLQQILAEKDFLTKIIFPLSVLFVFMVLAGQYESWSLPFAILLIVPMCLLAALIGVNLVKLDNSIFTQIGLITLIGLAAKNAILVVEFSKQLEDEGKSRVDAVVEASRVRLRPILMTAFAFILGVVPLVVAKGAGAEMRFALGVAVFSGMLGVTFFGLVFTPVFYDVIRRFAKKKAVAPIGVPQAHGADPSLEVPPGGAH